MGNPIPFGYRQLTKPQPASDVRLTIDRYIQEAAEQSLDAAIEKNGANGGTIIVMEPKTGAILAMASRPSFKLSELDLTDETKMDLYRNRAVTDLYEPGSVMKVVTMATALDLGLVTPNTTYEDSGMAYVGGYAIENWDFSANGTTTMTQLLAEEPEHGRGVGRPADRAGALLRVRQAVRLRRADRRRARRRGGRHGSHERGPGVVSRPTWRRTPSARG